MAPDDHPSPRRGRRSGRPAPRNDRRSPAVPVGRARGLWGEIGGDGCIVAGADPPDDPHVLNMGRAPLCEAPCRRCRFHLSLPSARHPRGRAPCTFYLRFRATPLGTPRHTRAATTNRRAPRFDPHPLYVPTCFAGSQDLSLFLDTAGRHRHRNHRGHRGHRDGLIPSSSTVPKNFLSARFWACTIGLILLTKLPLRQFCG
jgi:hypothetical protein